jgi:centrin-1
MQSLGFESKSQTIFQMIADLDKNANKQLDFEEFLDLMTARMSDKDTREDINKVFRLFDEDNTGSISIKNLRRVAKELGENLTDEELQEMVERADSNGDGAVSADDFYNIMTKKVFP